MLLKEYLAQKMSEYGISYRELEQKTGIGRGNLSNYMHGIKKPRTATIIKLATLFASIEAEYEALTEYEYNVRRAKYIVELSELAGA